jgi:hypothetical protein
MQVGDVGAALLALGLRFSASHSSPVVAASEGGVTCPLALQELTLARNCLGRCALCVLQNLWYDKVGQHTKVAESDKDARQHPTVGWGQCLPNAFVWTIWLRFDCLAWLHWPKTPPIAFLSLLALCSLAGTVSTLWQMASPHATCSAAWSWATSACLPRRTGALHAPPTAQPTPWRRCCVGVGRPACRTLAWPA